MNEWITHGFHHHFSSAFFFLFIHFLYDDGLYTLQNSGTKNIQFYNKCRLLVSFFFCYIFNNLILLYFNKEFFFYFVEFYKSFLTMYCINVYKKNNIRRSLYFIYILFYYYNIILILCIKKSVYDVNVYGICLVKYK